MNTSTDFSPFLTSISAVVAGLIGVFLATLAAYVVFLGERSSGYNAQIANDKVAISGSVGRISKDWRIDNSLGIYVPRGLATAYSGETKTSGSAEAVMALNEIAAQSMIPQAPTRLAITYERLKATDRYKGQEIGGRLYFWAIAQAAAIISGQVDGMYTLRTFPSSATGIGFLEWRSDFEPIAEKLITLDDMPFKPYLAQFDAFFIKNLASVPSQTTIPLQKISSLMDEVRAIKASLHDIDEQELLKKQYELSANLTTANISIELTLAILIGILAPLLFLAIGVPTNKLGALVILILSLLATFACYLQLILDVQGAHAPRENYFSERWEKPLEQVLESNSDNLRDNFQVELAPFVALIYSPSLDKKSALADKLSNYVTSGKKYNEDTAAFSAAFSKRLSGLLGENAYTDVNSASVDFYPASVFDDSAFDAFLNTVKDAANVNIGISDTGLKYSTSLNKIRREDVKANEVNGIIQAFTFLRDHVDDFPQYSSLKIAKSDLTESGASLMSLLSKQTP